jgi:hypothetical protein
MTTRRVAIIVFVLMSLSLAIWAVIQRAVFATYHPYDDEGYMLISLWHFVKVGGLYTKTFSQYGPFYFLLQPFLHGLLHLPINNDGDRLLTLFYILVSCGALAAFTARVTHRAIIGIVCFIGTLPQAIVLLQEPGHPQEVALVLLSLSVLLSLWMEGPRRGVVFFLLGCIGAAISLTKINVGVFYILTLWLVFVFSLKRNKFTKILIAGSAVISLLIPPILMRAHFQHWSLPLCIFCMLLIGELFWIAARNEIRTRIGPAIWMASVFGFIVTAVIVLVWAVGTGSSWTSLLDGIILRPVGHPGVFSMALPVPVPVLFFALAIAVLLIRYSAIGARVPRFALWLEAAKVPIGLLTLLLLPIARPALFWSAPFLPLVLVGNRSFRSNARDLPRLFLLCTIVLQLLQIYPVAATQLNVALTPLGAWACVLISDGWEIFKSILLSRAKFFESLFEAIIWPGLVALALGGLLVKVLYRDPQRGQTLGLPGAQLIRLPPKQVAVYRWLAYTIHANCDMLFGVPDFGSLNFWSGVQPPNGYNMGGWMTDFRPSEQEEIANRLRAASKPCIVHNETLRRFWAPYGEPQQAPLIDYIFKETVPVAHAAGYELRIPPRNLDKWSGDVILEGTKPLNGAEVGLPDGLLDNVPASTIRFDIKANGGKLFLMSVSAHSAGIPDLQLEGGKLAVATASSSTQIPVPGLGDGSWHSFSLVTSPTSDRLYIDGTLRCTLPSSISQRLPGAGYLLGGDCLIKNFTVQDKAIDPGAYRN